MVSEESSIPVVVVVIVVELGSNSLISRASSRMYVACASIP